MQVIQCIILALNALPSSEKPERLALFAQRISGNPHALDPDTSTGRLFLLALNDLAQASKNISQVEGEIEESVQQPSQDRMQELRLYAEVGLRVDTISSYVVAFQLFEAIDQRSGHLDPLLQATKNRVLLLPLRQVVEWRTVVPAKQTIFVCENPQVFEEIVEQQKDVSTSPTVICTSGWPSVAALMLLDLLLAQSAENMLYYSGDFDLKGLQIAAYLMTRYPKRCHLWHFDTDSYRVALQHGGVAVSTNELRILTTLPTKFATLVSMMQEKGMWAYQEGITQLLTMDIERT